MANSRAKASQSAGSSLTPAGRSAENSAVMSADLVSEKADENDHYHYQSAQTSRVLPVPMLPSEIVRIETAMYFAQVSDKTIRLWAHKDGIGRQAEKHSPLQISLPALLMKTDGEMVTLERLRAGARSHPAVRMYLQRAIALLEELRVNPKR